MKGPGFLVVLIALPTVVQAAPCQKYGPGSVAGTVHRVMFYGPPNYGESPKTDERGFYPVLKLDGATPFCSSGDAIKPVSASEMQMIFIPPDSAKNWYGKRVAVTGEMFPQESARHHTPVMLHVKAIRVAS